MANLASKSLNVLKQFGAWFGLAVLAGLTLYQLRALLLFVGLLAVRNPNLRPPGWSSNTLYGVNRCLFVILGAAWIMYTTYVGNYLMSPNKRHWERHIGRMALVLGILLISSYVLIFGLAFLFPDNS